ncbi:MAG: hypothetical protein ACON4U_04345 [Myxococcota bacterium]
MGSQGSRTDLQCIKLNMLGMLISVEINNRMSVNFTASSSADASVFSLTAKTWLLLSRHPTSDPSHSTDVAIYRRL